MASRQFRSDDTSVWKYKYGNGSNGDLTISGTTAFSTSIAGCSGTSGSNSLTLDAASTFANNDLILIIQMRGSSISNPNWELNKISSGAGTTSLTLEDNLTRNYVDSGADQAMVVKMLQYSNITINSTWISNLWDFNSGGIICALCNGTITGNSSGIIDLQWRGFKGADFNISDGTGNQGEGTGGSGAQSTSANGNAGGGGSGGFGNCAGGAGGSNGSQGTNGQSTGDHTGGTAGATAGTAELTTALMGGSGGAGGDKSDPGRTGGGGGRGGGMLFLFGKNIDLSQVTVRLGGQDGGTASTTDVGDGGAGAGGSALFKGERIILGALKTTANGGTGGTFGADGGNGGQGRIHADYGISISGSTSPTLSSRLDSRLRVSDNFINYIFI